MPLTKVEGPSIGTITNDLLINKTLAEFQVLHGGTAKGRLLQDVAQRVGISVNLRSDGANWNLDDTSVGGSLFYFRTDGSISWYEATAGSNPRTLQENLRFAAGGGLKFPVTQLVSTDPNTLDDYEEGSWTPVIGGVTSQTGQTYGRQVGRYVKIGAFVFLMFNVGFSAKGTITGNIVIRGIPFTISNEDSGGHNFASDLEFQAMASNWIAIHVLTIENNDYLLLRGISAAALNNANSLGTGDLTDTSLFRGILIYKAAN